MSTDTADIVIAIFLALIIKHENKDYYNNHCNNR